MLIYDRKEVFNMKKRKYDEMKALKGLIKRKIKTPARWVPAGIFCCLTYVASYFPYLICRCEFFKESYIVFREKSEVVNLVFEVGDSLYAHSEGITRILF